MKNIIHGSNGQMMLVVTMTLGSLLLASAGIASLLLIYQVRDANDSINSQKAFFAADAGIENESFIHFCQIKGYTACPKNPTVIFDDPGVSFKISSVTSPPNFDVVSTG